MPRKPAEKPWLAAGFSRSTWYRRRKSAETAGFSEQGKGCTECRFYWPPDEPSSAAITRAVRFYVSPPRPDRCDALVAELAAILARGQARLDARAINLAER
jgi:hypothetical protein